METPAPTPDHPKLPERKPWPMRWIVLVIVVYIIGYTWINIVYRKPGPGHEPWIEAQEREQNHKMRTVSASMNGWIKIEASITPATTDSSNSSAALVVVAARPAEARLDRVLPGDLVGIIRARPELYPGTFTVSVEPRIPAARSPHIEFAQAASSKPLPSFGEVLAYAKEKHLYVFIQNDTALIPDAEPVAASPVMHVVLPAGSLEAGSWKATLYAGRSEFDWEFKVE